MPKTYECWTSDDGTETSFFPSDHPQRDLHTTDVDGNPMTCAYTIMADNWEDAMLEHDFYQSIAVYNSRWYIKLWTRIQKFFKEKW